MILYLFSLVPGTPVQQLIFPRAKADPSTGYEPNRPRSPRGQNNPYRAASPAAPFTSSWDSCRQGSCLLLTYLLRRKDPSTSRSGGGNSCQATLRSQPVQSSMKRGNRLYVENWKRSNLRRRSLYKPGSICNTGNKKKQLPLLLECKLLRAILLKPQFIGC